MTNANTTDHNYAKPGILKTTMVQPMNILPKDYKPLRTYSNKKKNVNFNLPKIG